MALQNQITTWINFLSQDEEFVSSENIDPQLGDAYESISGFSSIRTSTLPVTNYTAGDTKDPGFKRLEAPALAQNPSRVLRRYAPLRREDFSGLRSPNPVFPKLNINSGSFAYPITPGRPTTLVDLFQRQEHSISLVKFPELENDDVPVDPIAAMIANQMGLMGSDLTLQSMKTNYEETDHAEIEESVNFTLESASSSPLLASNSVRTIKNNAATNTDRALESRQDFVQSVSIETSIGTSVIQDSTSQTETHLSSYPNRQTEVAEPSITNRWDQSKESTPVTIETSFVTEKIIQKSEAESLKESIHKSRRHIAQLESKHQESERIAVSRAEKRIRDRLRSELPPPPPEESAPAPRNSRVSMNPISEPIASEPFVKDYLDAPVTIREMQIIQQQHAVNESDMRQRIVKELRNETEAKIQRAQVEAEATSKHKLQATFRKIINS